MRSKIKYYIQSIATKLSIEITYGSLNTISFNSVSVEIEIIDLQFRGISISNQNLFVINVSVVTRGREQKDLIPLPMKHAQIKIGNKMPLYEHVFISRQDLSNTQAEGLVEHFGIILKDNGGKVVDSEYWGLKTMAYKMNKNRKGHYVMLRTDSPSEAVHEMERLMRLHEDVMRVLTIKVDKHDEGPSVQMHKRDDRGERREQRD